MADYEPTSVALTPQQKAALQNADRSNSEIVRQLVEGWRKHGSVEEVLEEDLEKEIEAINNEIEAKERRKQQKEEKLERLRDNSLHPSDEENLEEFLDRELNRVIINPEFDGPAQRLSSGTLTPERLIKEAAKRADSFPCDDLVLRFRKRGFEELTTETAPTQAFSNQYAVKPEPEFVVELLEIRNEVLPEDTDGTRERRDNGLRSVKGGSQ